MQAYEGYFENGRFYPAEQTMRVTGRRRAVISIFDEEGTATQIRSQKQLEAFRRFVAANKAVTDEPIDEEFDEILTRRVSVRELDL